MPGVGNSRVFCSVLGSQYVPHDHARPVAEPQAVSTFRRSTCRLAAGAASQGVRIAYPGELWVSKPLCLAIENTAPKTCF